MNGDLSDIEAKCPSCGRVFSTTVTQSRFTVNVGEAIEDGEKVGLFQYVCTECAEKEGFADILPPLEAVIIGLHYFPSVFSVVNSVLFSQVSI